MAARLPLVINTGVTEQLQSSDTLAATSTGLQDATGAVVTSAATAPTSGQVLTATSGTAATWQTPAETPGLTLNNQTPPSIGSGSVGYTLTTMPTGSLILIRTTVTVVVPFAGPSLTAATVSLEKNGDASGTYLNAANMLLSAGSIISSLATDIISGQSLNATVQLTGCNLNQLTAGSFSVNMYFVNQGAQNFGVPYWHIWTYS